VVLVSPFVVTAVFLHQGTLASIKDWSAAGVASAFVGFAAAQAVSTWLAGRWVDSHGAARVFRIYLWPVTAAMLLLAFAPSTWALWGLFLGLGFTAGGNSVVSGALWADVFGIDNLGLVRGVYTGFMVITTAVSPLLLGLALEAGVRLPMMALAVATYAALVPWLAARPLKAHVAV
jgi:MFS family permease